MLLILFQLQQTEITLVVIKYSVRSIEYRRLFTFEISIKVQ